MGRTIRFTELTIEADVLKELLIAFLLIIDVHLGERVPGKTVAGEFIVQGQKTIVNGVTIDHLAAALGSSLVRLFFDG